MLSAEPNQRHEVLKGIGSERSNNLNQTKYGGENEATEDDIYEFTGRNSEWWMPQGRWDGWIRGSLRLPAAVASRLVSPRPARRSALPLCFTYVAVVPRAYPKQEGSQSLNGPWAVTLEILRGGFFYFLFSFFTKIYFRFGNLQEYTPAAQLLDGRYLAAR